MPEVDIAIVGAGPTGLYAAYYAGFRGLSVAVVDTLPEPGGQVTAMYPEKVIFDVAGFPVIKGRELVANLVEQAATFNPTYLLGVRAEKLDLPRRRPPGADPHRRRRLHLGAVLITGGLGSFTARPLPAAERSAATGSCSSSRTWTTDRQERGHRRRRRLGVRLGARAAAVAKSVTLVHRRDKFRAHARTVAKVQALPVRDHRQRRGHRDPRRRPGRRAAWSPEKGGHRAHCRPTRWSPRSASPPTSVRWPSGAWSWTSGTSWSTRRRRPTCPGLRRR